MEERNKVYKRFEGKKVFILTNSNFRYNTHDLKVLNNQILFTDKFGKQVLVSFDEVRTIQEIIE